MTGKRGQGFVTAFAGVLLVASSAAANQGRTIVDLQINRTASSIRIKRADGPAGVATLINLNPAINSWHLLQIDAGAGTLEQTYHLQNADPRGQALLLDESNPGGIVIAHGKERVVCDLWSAKDGGALVAARQSAVPYAPLCGERIYLLNPTRGHQTPIEAVTDLLREKVPGGEKVVSFVRDTFFARLYRKKAEEPVESMPVAVTPRKQPVEGPAAALVDPDAAVVAVKPLDLGIEIEGSVAGSAIPGDWYPAKDIPGVFVSVITPGRIAPKILRSYPTRVNNLGSVESGQLVYLVAFDLDQFDVHYVLGTTHPGVEWSGRVQSRMKEASLPGPDGIDTGRPLVRTGFINPSDAPRTVAGFIGGFKRYHGAFRDGQLAQKNHGSHYGFVEEGVLFSTLQPELATLYLLDDGQVDMKTWTAEDTKTLLPRVRSALQNGVPLVTEYDASVRISVPGPLVNRWGDGNWSATADLKQQSMRAAVALQESRGRRYLVYAFFWSATPSAITRVLQAYQCRYGLPLDMNALEHTYLAVYKKQGSNIAVEHLIRKMAEVDLTAKGRSLPRFLGYPDDRDFFYLTRRGTR
jgi:hypothetical protein